MLLTTVTLRTQPHKRAEVVSVVDELVQRMRETPGCSRSRLLGEVEDANILAIVSEWDSAIVAEAFMASRDFQILKGIKMLLRSEPLVVFDEIPSRATRLFGQL